jgi:uncharacterized protein (TIGR03118 family)
MIHRLTFFLAGLVVIATPGISGRAADSNNYDVTILVSNEADEAPVTDPKLVNAWGIAASATSPWWVSNNGTGSSTIYTGDGVKQALEVTVPGAPTGMVFNGGTHFLAGPAAPARFMWASEDGTISGWNASVDATHAHVLFTNAGSVFKGLTINGDVLYVSDFGTCSVRMIDGIFHDVTPNGSFADGSVPDGYCPFGIQVLDGAVFVTYAVKSGMDDVPGVSHGLVRQFDLDGNFVARVASHGTLNSPWGLAMAPADFGRFSGCLLVGNFGDGLINAFCPRHDGQDNDDQANDNDDDHGAFSPSGRLKTRQGHDIQIDGLWGLGFGNGGRSGPTNVLYFAAGPDAESNGYFGRIDFKGGDDNDQGDDRASRK